MCQKVNLSYTDFISSLLRKLYRFFVIKTTSTDSKCFSVHLVNPLQGLIKTSQMQFFDKCFNCWLWCAPKFLSLWNGPMKKLLWVMWRFPGFSRGNIMGFCQPDAKMQRWVFCWATAWLLHLCLPSDHQLHLGNFIQTVKKTSHNIRCVAWVSLPMPGRAWGLSSHPGNPASPWDPELRPGQARFFLTWFCSHVAKKYLKVFCDSLCSDQKNSFIMSAFLDFFFFFNFQTHGKCGAFGCGCIQKGKYSEGLCL